MGAEPSYLAPMSSSAQQHRQSDASLPDRSASAGGWSGL